MKIIAAIVLRTLVLGCGVASTDVALAIPVFNYVPELTGMYHIGEVADFSDAEEYGVPATLRQTNTTFSWDGAAPRYMTYELEGVLRAPVAIALGPLEPYENPREINFNGGYIFSPRPGVAWGTTLNTNRLDLEGVGARFEHRYNGETGRFYVGLTYDTSVAYGGNPWSGLSRLTASLDAVFYNYEHFTSPVEYSDRGFVFVESARVGLSDQMLLPSSVPMNRLAEYSGPAISSVPEPETYVILLIGVGLIGFIPCRKPGYSREALKPCLSNWNQDPSSLAP